MKQVIFIYSQNTWYFTLYKKICYMIHPSKTNPQVLPTFPNYNPSIIVFNPWPAVNSIHHNVCTCFFNILFCCGHVISHWCMHMTRLPISYRRLNTLRPRQNGRHFADDIFKRIFFNENVWISIKISLKFVPKGPINKIPALFQIMAGRCPGDKPLSEAMLVSLLTHKCVTRPQWV